MNKVLVAVAALSMSASVAFAGGPEKIEEEAEPEVIIAETGSSGSAGSAASSAGAGAGGVAAALFAAALLAALAGGDGT
jgi:hypothetical protein